MHGSPRFPPNGLHPWLWLRLVVNALNTRTHCGPIFLMRQKTNGFIHRTESHSPVFLSMLISRFPSFFALVKRFNYRFHIILGLATLIQTRAEMILHVLFTLPVAFMLNINSFIVRKTLLTNLYFYSKTIVFINRIESVSLCCDTVTHASFNLLYISLEESISYRINGGV